jgi:predicted tellurium resistance membrane protein TerC
MSWITGLFTVENLIALLTLTALEIVLGIDNIVFIAILTGKLPRERQGRARTIGLILAMGTRILLLLAISWMAQLTSPLFTLINHGVSGRDIIMLVGGLFLIAKSTYEIHHQIEGPETEKALKKSTASFKAVIIQIIAIDLVFSLDSVITAVGMAQHKTVMIMAVIAAVGVMLFASKPISDFVHHHPTMKMLALSFLLLIGVMLVADGMGQHVSKGYIYFAMAFSLVVELLNIRMRKTTQRAK